MTRGIAFSNKEYVGKHVLCDIKLLENPSNDELISIIEQSIIKSNMNIVQNHCHEFEPHGITAFWILSESHFSLHTYPEKNYITVCCYTCGNEGDPESAVEYLISKLKVDEFESKVINRGNI